MPLRSAAQTGATAALLLGLVAIPGSTTAYTISTTVSAGCHEDLTSDALRAVRLDLWTAGPLSASPDEMALIDDVEFSPPGDMKDLGGITLLVSVRDNDLKGRASNDLRLLAGVHGDPNNQDEHCLRSAEEDEPGGSEAAVNSCRKFIRGRVVEALDGLDAKGAPDPGKRTSLPVHLTLRGSMNASLPTYYVRIGQALHGIEDSFTHTYRTADGMKITVALNWIDEANGILQESRDGPAHAHGLDACNNPDELRTLRRKLATEASIALLRATLDPGKAREAKMVRVDELLDQYLGYAPGCTFANNWCDAPERQYKDTTGTMFGCSSGGAGFLGGTGALLGLAILSRRRRKIPSVAAAVLLVCAAALPGTVARAAEPPPPTRAEKAAEAEKHVPPAPVTVPVPQPGPRDPSEAAWGAYLGASGSIDNPALAGQLGIRRRMSTHWTLGWDVEWNPWATVSGATTLHAGTFNTYGTAILRFPLAYENFNLRTTVNLGASYLLFDLYGAPKGSLGAYAAVSPLGLEWKLSRKFLLIVNPINFALPVPQLKGVPLTYTQYRFSIGFGILAG